MEHRFGTTCVGRSEHVQAMSRSETDWHAIERDYVAGMLSLREWPRSMAVRIPQSPTARVVKAGSGNALLEPGPDTDEAWPVGRDLS
jgi:hypothetical protein